MTYLFNQQIFDAAGKCYYIKARTIDPNVLNVVPVDGKHGGLNFCILHQVAYTDKQTCDGCVSEPISDMASTAP